MPQDRPVKDIMVQALVRKPFAGGTTIFEVPAKSFHRVGPVAPHRAPALDTVCDVKKCVDGERTDWQSLRVSLIVDAVAR